MLVTISVEELTDAPSAILKRAILSLCVFLHIMRRKDMQCIRRNHLHPR